MFIGVALYHVETIRFIFKAGVDLKAVFPPLNLGLMRISRSRFKQSKNSLLISGKSMFCDDLQILG